jgi:hypothetical protein
MLVIESIEYSENPISIKEACLMSIALTEIFALWSDVTSTTWETLSTCTWDDMKRKIF